MRILYSLAALFISCVFVLAPPVTSAAEPDMNGKCYGPTKTLTPELKAAFVEEVSALAIKAEHDHGIPAPILAAMSIDESGYGTTKLALATHNVLSYKWSGKSGPGGRALFTLTCQDKNDEGNVYIVFKDRADAADFVSDKLAKSKYYKAATLAYRQAVASGADREASAKAWFRTIAPTYNPYQSQAYIAKVLKAADDPIEVSSGKRDPKTTLWNLATVTNATKATDPKKGGGAQAHLAAVKKAQLASYAITQATNDCPSPAADMFGWPAKKLKACDYKVGPKASPRTAHVVLLDVPPEQTVAWIETACSKQLQGLSGCFDVLVKCAQNNSGMMIPVSGNMMEDMDGVHWKNYFFRNGMTVTFETQGNGGTDQIDSAKQNDLTTMPDSAIKSIPSGVTRFWRTKSQQFAKQFPNQGAPANLKSPAERQQWLDTAKQELLNALSNPENRLLTAWVGAHPKTLAKGVCPEDNSP
ncbi:glucosaminidase domain-containing protein [Mesorhizobium sp. B2-1-8]|uniref:glucosaminidase domain-containing protein n=1 Tax=Mesorhizobium sp. B2-1-8 TaxID=2589967 RepID=UPI0015E2BD37|nr:glucosaminidase domain-containing protein [Mesorhizobium sp. B2-1-8]UCI19918.1 glucosaminidase domain-containing protein [Mesorhizobium sp. B2-1-8]